jgi:hypothetical protein
MERLSYLPHEVDFMIAPDARNFPFVQPHWNLQELRAVVITWHLLENIYLAGEGKLQSRRMQRVIFSASVILFARSNRVRWNLFLERFLVIKFSLKKKRSVRAGTSLSFKKEFLPSETNLQRHGINVNTLLWCHLSRTHSSVSEFLSVTQCVYSLVLACFMTLLLSQFEEIFWLASSLVLCELMQHSASSEWIENRS